ncbi:hypothetical protein DRE_01031 [Drechslerella stenobrocha 248]|uniref:Uncharacterized protein n=1 Tax=Drechslerella stenobrocha 248 TaxID=1043628 RepID=W7HXX4_9PEZI|nr:hypothetical protein DRE_01031 [Drechslerella stenobrocha 248]
MENLDAAIQKLREAIDLVEPRCAAAAKILDEPRAYSNRTLKAKYLAMHMAQEGGHTDRAAGRIFRWVKGTAVVMGSSSGINPAFGTVTCWDFGHANSILSTVLSKYELRAPSGGSHGDDFYKMIDPLANRLIEAARFNPSLLKEFFANPEFEPMMQVTDMFGRGFRHVAARIGLRLDYPKLKGSWQQTHPKDKFGYTPLTMAIIHRRNSLLRHFIDKLPDAFQYRYFNVTIPPGLKLTVPRNVKSVMQDSSVYWTMNPLMVAIDCENFAALDMLLNSQFRRCVACPHYGLTIRWKSRGKGAVEEVKCQKLGAAQLAVMNGHSHLVQRIVREQVAYMEGEDAWTLLWVTFGCLDPEAAGCLRGLVLPPEYIEAHLSYFGERSSEAVMRVYQVMLSYLKQPGSGTEGPDDSQHDAALAPRDVDVDTDQAHAASSGSPGAIPANIGPYSGEGQEPELTLDEYIQLCDTNELGQAMQEESAFKPPPAGSGELQDMSMSPSMGLGEPQDISVPPPTELEESQDVSGTPLPPTEEEEPQDTSLPPPAKRLKHTLGARSFAEIYGGLPSYIIPSGEQGHRMSPPPESIILGDRTFLSLPVPGLDDSLLVQPMGTPTPTRTTVLRPSSPSGSDGQSVQLQASEPAPVGTEEMELPFGLTGINIDDLVDEEFFKIPEVPPLSPVGESGGAGADPVAGVPGGDDSDAGVSEVNESGVGVFEGGDLLGDGDDESLDGLLDSLWDAMKDY